MRKTLYTYLVREQLVTLLVCLAGVSFVLVTAQLLQLMRILFASSCSLKDIGQIVLFAMPKLFLYGGPMAALLGVMLAFVRLNSDNELIAFRSAGTAFCQFLPPVLAVLIFVTILAFINAIYVIPISNAAFEIKLKSLGRASIPALLKEGTFVSSIPNLVFFFRSVDHSDLSIKGVFVQDQRQPNEKVTITAERAQIIIPQDSSSITFRVADGVITRAAKDLKDAQAVSFRNYDFTISMDEIMGAAQQGMKSKREMNLKEVYHSIKASTERKWLVYWSLEFHHRIAFPAACLLLGLLGPPLGSLSRQRNRMTGITVAVGVFLAYYVILSAGKGLGENNVISPFFAVWTPNLLSFALAVYLWAKMHRETPFFISNLDQLTRRLPALFSRRR